LNKNNKLSFEYLGSKVDDNIFILISVLGTVLFGLGCADFANYNFQAEWESCVAISPCIHAIKNILSTKIVMGIILLLVGAIGANVGNSRLKQQNNDLRLKAESLNSVQEELDSSKSRLFELQKDLVKTWLKGAANFLTLDTSSRVTIYYEDDGSFYLLARYSRNPSYDKIHRQKFSLNQGVISRAWEHGTCIETGCPSNSSNGYQEYLQKKYNYDVDKINSLNMKSCRYLAKAIVDADKHIGVIVFEGTETNFLDNDFEKRADKYCEQYQSQLSAFVRNILEFDKELNIKTTYPLTVEDDLLELVG
jgi:type II secretory pathway pseudopilin PulG